MKRTNATKTYTHEPSGYECPFCKLVRGQEDKINKREYVVYEDEKTLAYVSPLWWVNNPGNVLVITKEHVENVYSIPDELLAVTYQTAKKVAHAIKETYQCDGTSMRQHNEPAGDQGVWHFHVHVFPRFVNDDLYKNHYNFRWVDHDEKMQYVLKLKEYFAN